MSGITIGMTANGNGEMTNGPEIIGTQQVGFGKKIMVTSMSNSPPLTEKAVTKKVGGTSLKRHRSGPTEGPVVSHRSRLGLAMGTGMVNGGIHLQVPLEAVQEEMKRQASMLAVAWLVKRMALRLATMVAEALTRRNQ